MKYKSPHKNLPTIYRFICFRRELSWLVHKCFVLSLFLMLCATRTCVFPFWVETLGFTLMFFIMNFWFMVNYGSRYKVDGKLSNCFEIQFCFGS